MLDKMDIYLQSVETNPLANNKECFMKTCMLVVND